MNDIYLIMRKAQDKTNAEIENINKVRNADAVPQMALTENQEQKIYTYNLVRNAICEYHEWLKGEFEKQGLNFPDLGHH